MMVQLIALVILTALINMLLYQDTLPISLLAKEELTKMKHVNTAWLLTMKQDTALKMMRRLALTTQSLQSFMDVFISL
jgi:hypothetical protein